MLIAFAKRTLTSTFLLLITLTFLGHLSPQVAITSAQQPSEIRIDPSVRTGAIVTHFGFDLKGGRNVTKKLSDATLLYGDTNANLVRIPILAKSHNADGSVAPAVYAQMFKSIHNIKSVNPDAEVFASLKLLNEQTFPGWIASNEDGSIFGTKVKRPDPKKYAQLVADYVELLAQENIVIDFLGLNNECSGALTPDRYIATAKELNRLLKRRKLAKPFRSFQYIGSEGFGVPTSVRYAEAIRNAGGLDFADIFGSHFYPDHASGKIEDWTRLTDATRRPTWHTEVHVRSSEIPAEHIAKVRDGLAIVFKTNQRGVQGYIWWARANGTDFVNRVRRSVVNSLRGGSCVLTSGNYLAKGNPKEATLFQATRVEDTVWLWCCNPGPAISNVTIRLESKAAESSQGQFWAGGSTMTESTLGELVVELSPKNRGRKLIVKQLPATSISLVKIDLVNKRKKKTLQKTVKNSAQEPSKPITPKPTEPPADSPLVAQREWKSTTGPRAVLATLVSVKDGVGQFRRENGESFEFAIDKLTPADQAIVADALKNQ